MAMSETKQKPKSLLHSGHTAIRKAHEAPGIEDFEVLKPISRGAFGQVYLCRKRGNRKLFAMKVMKKADVRNKNMMDQVVAERDALAISSKSPFVVQLFYSFQSTEKIFLVMEYMIGGDLKSLLHNFGFFDEQMARAYIAEVALALEYLHRHNIIHRDIKPDNMLVSDKGHIKLTDFGLTKLTTDRKPGFIDLINTPYEVKSTMKQGSHVFWRTPGQLLSLTSQFTFSVPKIKLEPKDKQLQMNMVILSSSVSNCRSQYVFSSPQYADESTSDKSYQSTPRGVKRSYGSIATDMCDSTTFETNSGTGLTQDVQEVRISAIHKKVKPEFCLPSPDAEDLHFARRVRGYSQSLPSDVEISFKFQDAPHCAADSLVTSGNSDFVDDSSKIMDTQFSGCEQANRCALLSETYRFNMSPSEGCSDNISGVTDLSAATHLSASPGTCSKAMELSPLSVNDTQELDNRNSLMPAQDGFHAHVLATPPLFNSENYAAYCATEKSPNWAENCVYIDPGSLRTPVQTLRFGSCSSPAASNASQDVLQDKDLGPPVSSTDSCSYSFDCKLKLTHPNGGQNGVTPLKTPYRTPKSCARHTKSTTPGQPVFGTPDYLAPEILLNLEYGMAVDWWALGVCLYEFLTGIPPFNDESVELVFEHILNRHLLWPTGDESLSCHAVDAIEKLLTVDPILRPCAKEIKSMAFFNEINWKDLHNSNAPFIPQPDSICDTSYFDARNAANHLQMSAFKL